MASQRTLVVVGQTGVMLVPLPWKGSQLFVGRDAFCEVHLADEQVSRQHARLTRERVATAATETAAAPEAAPATETTMLADLGSRNGTTVDGRRVAPASPVTLAVGSVVRIGNALLVIEDRKGPARLQLVAGVGALVRGVDDEIARAVAEGSTFALVEVRIEGGEGRPGSASPRDRAGRAAAPLFYAWQEGQYVTLDAEHMVTTGLRDGDVLAPLGEGVWLALLPKATPARARQQAARLSLLLEEAGFQARVRLALFPDQGTTSDALLLALGEGGEADEAAGAAEADEADDAA
nr:FHA domain-containing protein [Polyangiaceae bacterium]